jgi:hypothetical protein
MWKLCDVVLFTTHGSCYIILYYIKSNQIKIVAYFNWEDNIWVKYILFSINFYLIMRYVLKINLCCLSIDKILFIECVLKKCKLCQNNPNANSIHIVIMPSTYCINDHINIESSTYSHQFDDLLTYIVPMLVIFFSLI